MSMKPCPETFPYPLIALDETDSTNRYISQLCNELQESVAELTTVTAEFQTAGKGQRGNTWEAERGKNLLFSFVLYPTFSGSAPPVYPITNRVSFHQGRAGQMVGRNYDKVAE